MAVSTHVVGRGSPQVMTPEITELTELGVVAPL